MKKIPEMVHAPEEDRNFDLVAWKTRHSYHYETNQHVSLSPFAHYFGSLDHGCRLHIPPAGPERDKMNVAIEKDAQAARCRALRGNHAN